MGGTLDSYQIPTSVREAVALFGEHSEHTAVIAGGTALGQRRSSRVTTLVDIGRCGLEYAQVGMKEVRLGATLPLAAIAADEALDGFGTGILREAAAAVTPQAVRNQVTLGGDLVGCTAWSDLPPALLVLEASVETTRPGNRHRIIGVEKLLGSHPRRCLASGEIVCGVRIAKPPSRCGAAYVRLARTVSDIALASAAARVSVRGDAFADVRLAVGAPQPRPLRATGAEQLLEGAEATDMIVAEAAELAVAQLPGREGLRAETAYRRHLLGVAVKRAVTTAWQRALGTARYEAPRRPVPPPWTRKPPSSRDGREVAVEVDGVLRHWRIEPEALLLTVLRREGIFSVKRGCDEGYCGTCSVLVDGRLLNACLLLAAQVDGCKITTAAGLGSLFRPHALQRALVEEGAVQCGFCTPGMVVAGHALLESIPDPTQEEIRAALDGNLCRCTGYAKPLKAVREAAAAMWK